MNTPSPMDFESVTGNLVVFAHYAASLKENSDIAGFIITQCKSRAKADGWQILRSIRMVAYVGNGTNLDPKMAGATEAQRPGLGLARASPPGQIDMAAYVGRVHWALALRMPT